LLKFLEVEKVQCVFSIPGGPVLPVYDALRAQDQIHNILVRHECAGAFMADGLARVTGTPGVCVSTMGPGAGHMVAGVATSFSDSIPILAITGQLPNAVAGRGFQQETDHVQLFRSITKWSSLVNTAGELNSKLRRAFRVALTGRTGPVHLDIRKDALTGDSEFCDPDPRTYRPITNPSADPNLIRQTLGVLSESERPVILAGGGVILASASEELAAFAETAQVPVCTSYNGRGAVAETSKLCMGRGGEFTPSYVSDILAQSDLLIAAGYRFTDVSMEGWSIGKETKIVQFDIDPAEIGRNFDVELGVVADLKATFSGLLSQAGTTKKHSDWANICARKKQQWWQHYETIMQSNSIPIKPQRIFWELNKRLSSSDIITAGAGRGKMWAATLTNITRPRTWVHSGGYAPMGYALCSAIGAKLGAPGRKTVAICGDAGFQMYCEELITAVENNASITVCIINDGCLGSIRYAQQKSYGGRIFGTELKVNPDLSEVAKSFKADGERVTDPSGLGAALDRSFESDVPYVIDVRVDPEENPLFA